MRAVGLASHRLGLGRAWSFFPCRSRSGRLGFALLYVVLLGVALADAIQLQSEGAGLRGFRPGWMELIVALGWLSVWAIRLVVWRGYRPWPDVATRELPRLSVLIPCYNEGAGIAEAIRSVDRADYPRDRLELIVVDDGSADDSAAWAAQALKQASLPARLIRLPRNRGKRGALMRAMREAHGELWVTTDSDCRLDPLALRQLVAPLVRDPAIGAVAGRVEVDNPRGWLSRLLRVSFRLSFDWGRAIQSRVGQVLCVPGAAAAYRAAAVRPLLPAWCGEIFEDSSGGTSGDGSTSGGGGVGEDRELTNRLLARGWRSVYQATAVVETRVPERLLGTWGAVSGERHKFKKNDAGAGVWGMYLRWARGDVRESWWYARRLFGRRRGYRLADGYFILLLIESLAPYAWLIGLGALVVADPAWLAVTPALAVLGGAPMGVLYAMAYGRGDALRAPLLTLLWPLLRAPIELLALLTPNHATWLTRPPEVPGSPAVRWDSVPRATQTRGGPSPINTPSQDLTPCERAG